MKIIIFLVGLFALSAGAVGLYATDHDHSSTVDSHSGRTNSEGCHNNHKTGGYHCHKRK